MPIYEYRCKDCTTEFESIVTSANVNSTTCPCCGAAEPKRLMSVIGGMGGGVDPSPPVCGGGACERCS
ncbi:MAG: zinc ribbon domain-containing protein [Actinomycetota bacterium]